MSACWHVPTVSCDNCRPTFFHLDRDFTWPDMSQKEAGIGTCPEHYDHHRFLVVGPNVICEKCEKIIKVVE